MDEKQDPPDNILQEALQDMRNWHRVTPPTDFSVRVATISCSKLAEADRAGDRRTDARTQTNLPIGTNSDPKATSAASVHERIQQELALVFWNRDDSTSLLIRSKFPRPRIPDFQTPYVFWTKVITDARNGAIDNGIRPIIQEALSLYPHNQVFRDYLHEAPPPTRAPEPPPVNDRTLKTEPEKGELDEQTIRTALDANACSSRTAFVRLYQAYEPRVRYAVGRAIARSGYRGPIEDIRQDVWCYFVQRDRGALRYYDPTRGSFGPFIQRLAYQRALVAIQRFRRHTERATLDGGLEDSAEDPRTHQQFAVFVQSDYCDKILKLAEREFDDDDRMLLRELYGKGRSCLAIAKEQHIQSGTIYKRHERLKNKLKRCADEINRSIVDSRSSTNSLAAS